MRLRRCRRLATMLLLLVAGADPGTAGSVEPPGPVPAAGASAVPVARPSFPTPADVRGVDRPPVVVWTRAEGARGIESGDPGTGDDGAARARALRPTTVRIAGMLDDVAPFPWRLAVGSLAIGCRPVGDLVCPGGVVEDGDRIVISPWVTGWSDDTLAYVLRHELAHVWQNSTGDLEARRRDLDGIDLGPDVAADIDPLEAAADCLAAAWGSPARGSGYLACPPAGVARMAAVFAANPP